MAQGCGNALVRLGGTFSGPMTGARHKFGRLDGLRGVAALAVVLYHLPGPLHALAPRGYLAVDLFFLLSGFVIAAAYEERLRDGAMSLGTFALVRLKRLWPLYGLGVVVGVLAFSLVRTLRPDAPFLFPDMPLAAAVAMSLLFLPQLGYGGPAFPFNSASWSLSVEIFGNLAYASMAKSLRTPMLAVASAAGLAGLAIVMWRNGNLNVGVSGTNMAGGYLRFVFAFPLGVLLYRLDGRLPQVEVPAGLPLLVTAFAFSGALPDLMVAAVLFPAVLIASRRGAPMLQWAGMLSYPLYILHPPLIAAMEALTPAEALPVASLAVLGLSLGGAALANRYFDRPVQGRFAHA